MAEAGNTFDEFALGVLQLNAQKLEEERKKAEELQAERPVLEIYFSIKTTDPNIHMMHGAVNSFHMRETINEAWAATHTGKPPSNNCYVESLHIMETKNQFPVDVQLSCRQYDRIPGNFYSSKICGDDSDANKTKNALWVLGAQENYSYENGRPVFSAQSFVESKTFAMYHSALSYDIDDHTSKIKGGNQVEYLSPTCRIRGGEVHRADWFLDVMFRNGSAFASPVTSLSFPTTALNQEHFNDSEDDGADLDYAISLRMAQGDWNHLKSAVNESVTGPLRKSIMDMHTDPVLDFLLVPEIAPINGATMTSGQSASQRSGSGYWQALAEYIDSDANKTQLFAPRVMAKMKMTVRFV